MRIFSWKLTITLGLILISKVAFTLELKPVLDLSLAKKMADACEAKKATTDWRP